MFPRLTYLEWMSDRADSVPFDLATTGLRTADGNGDDVVPPEIADLAPAPAGVSLEHLLATEYAVQPEQVLVTAGATHAYFVATATALEDGGDGVLVERPGHQPLVETPRGLGANVRRFPRGSDGDLDPDTVADRLSEETVLVTVTNRHNPTGALLTDAPVERVAVVAATADAPLLVDEVYAPYVVEEHDGPFGGPTVAGQPNTVVTGSLTKFFGYGDLRIGWLIGPRAFVERARQVAYHVPDVAEPSRTMAERVVYNAESLVDDRRARVEANHRLLAAFLEKSESLSGTIDDGSTFAFVEPTDTTANTVIEKAWEAGVLVAPGRFFGDENRIRIGAGASPTDVEASLGQLETVLTDVRRTSKS